MNNIPLQPGPTYGPVRSRRLGWSLGLNICPTSYKLCSFNCVYCQYGWTTVHTLDSTGRLQDLPSVDGFAKGLEDALRQDRPIDNITFSGNGEATLHPQFTELVDIAVALKKTYRPLARLGILSNSSTVADERVRHALAELDFCVMKLDAGNIATFTRINRPCRGVGYNAILDGLRSIDNLSLQAMFVNGEIQNVGEQEIDRWIERITEIRPVNIQIYSLHRPPAASGLLEVTEEKLNEIAARVKAVTGITVEVIIAASPYSERVHQPWRCQPEQKQ
ncbi:MAG: radical SAM protein [Dehalococcoidales bacterium]|nr:radical SAM protein [Dehalococcoidales bacterium]